MKSSTHAIVVITAFAMTSSGFAQRAVQPPRQGPPPGSQQPQGPQTGEHPAQRPHDKHTTPPFRPANPRQPKLGDPLPFLTPKQLADFYDGKDDFEQEEDIEGGLGPIFNRNACSVCHAQGAVGGGSDVNVTRFGLLADGVFDPLEDLGGSLMQDSSILGHGIEIVPPIANVTAQRNSTPLFGLGLIEAIPDATILHGVKKRNPDGVVGKPAMIHDVATDKERVGRFGWKAQQAHLLSFAADAYVNEMGITSRLFPTENAPNGNLELLAQLDTIADPEDTTDPVTGKADIDRAADFMRLLAPAPRVKPTRATQLGGVLFRKIQCTACHTPRMITGPSPVRSLSRRPVWLYSDLLLHDMGTLGDGIAQGPASTTEMKTAPLWGLRFTAPYLHDGSAETVDQAILAHDGEAKAARDRYEALTTEQQQRIVEFLMTL
ncbi:MAG: hypothetical protein KDK97_17115 [Verrucomicrobiales bacterium]|nr:hypothetical protein [Verrucomicrobiales bacterium]MCP5557344.1 hypothetical protein [Verrucomicrobiaceae bacterium]